MSVPPPVKTHIDHRVGDGAAETLADFLTWERMACEAKFVGRNNVWLNDSIRYGALVSGSCPFVSNGRNVYYVAAQCF